MQERKRVQNNQLLAGEKYAKFMRQNASIPSRLKRLLDRMKGVPLENIRVDPKTGYVRFTQINMGLSWLIDILPHYTATEAARETLSDEFLRKAFREYDIKHSYTGLTTLSFTHTKFLQAAGIFATAIDTAIESGATGSGLEKAILKILKDRLDPLNYQQKKPLGDTGTLTTAKSKKIQKQVADWELDKIHAEPTDARVLAALGQGVLVGGPAVPANSKKNSALLNMVIGATEKTTIKSNNNPWHGAFGVSPDWAKSLEGGSIGIEDLMNLTKRSPGMKITLLNGRNRQHCYLGHVIGEAKKYFVGDGLSLSNFWTGSSPHLGLNSQYHTDVIAIVRDFTFDCQKCVKNYVFVVKEVGRYHWNSCIIPAHGGHLKTEYNKSIGDAIGFIREKKAIKMKPLSDSNGIPCMGYGFTVGGGKWSIEKPRIRISYQNYTKEVEVTCPAVTYIPKPKPKLEPMPEEEIPMASVATTSSESGKQEQSVNPSGKEDEIIVTKVY